MSAVNVNLGVLGHVDSGKTSLVAAMSTTLSTAALDKHPQSKERGITLDLGFSSFKLDRPDGFECKEDQIEFTLVDCPGHASLIRTIIGGAQIIDAMILVIDITKGIQAQTAECIVIGELVTDKMVIALNKIDQIPVEDREKSIQKMSKKISKTLQITKFKDSPIIPVAAKPVSNGDSTSDPMGIEQLVSAVVDCLKPMPKRDYNSPFLFAVDHCFPVKGQGTVLTGTVLKGSVKVGEVIEIANLHAQRKIKSMQVFKKTVQNMKAGDRGGICVAQLDSKLIERGLVCAPGTVPTFKGAIIRADKIRFYNGKIESDARFHISVGHTTVMGQITAFGLPDGESNPFEQDLNGLFDINRQYIYQRELYDHKGRPIDQGSDTAGESNQTFNIGPQWLLVKFEKPVTVPQGSLVIGSRFDTEVEGSQCRLAFYGRIMHLVDPDSGSDMASIKVYKIKRKEGYIERVMPSGQEAIVKDMFSKESDVSIFVGFQIVTGNGLRGKLVGSFGKSGKVKIEFDQNISLESERSCIVQLQMKRFIFAEDRKNLSQ